jgi:hypothetical protein
VEKLWRDCVKIVEIKTSNEQILMNEYFFIVTLPDDRNIHMTCSEEGLPKKSTARLLRNTSGRA